MKSKVLPQQKGLESTRDFSAVANAKSNSIGTMCQEGEDDVLTLHDWTDV